MCCALSRQINILLTDVNYFKNINFNTMISSKVWINLKNFRFFSLFE